MFQVRATGSDIRSRLHRRRLLCRCVASCRFGGFPAQQRQGQHGNGSFEETGTKRLVFDFDFNNLLA